MKTFYVQIEIEVEDHYNVVTLGNDLYRCCGYLEIDENIGYDVVINRVAVKPF